MKKIFLIVSLIFVSQLSFAFENSDTQQIVSNELTDLTEKWNEGDINNFVTAYKNSDSTRFINTTIIDGYNKILSNYKSRFPTRDKMGKLSLTDIDIKVLSSDYAIATGKWHLKQGKKRSQGIFTLLFEDTKTDGWKIVLDHTSS